MYAILVSKFVRLMYFLERIDKCQHIHLNPTSIVHRSNPKRKREKKPMSLGYVEVLRFKKTENEKFIDISFGTARNRPCEVINDLSAMKRALANSMENVLKSFGATVASYCSNKSFCRRSRS